MDRKGDTVTVMILVNGSPIFTQSVVNMGRSNGDGRTVFDRADLSEDFIYHYPEDGLIPLAEQIIWMMPERKDKS